MKLQRFNPTERIFHWAFAVPVLLMATSGGMIILASLGIISTISKEELLFLHTRIGFVLIILPVLVYLLGDRRTLQRNLGEIFRFSTSDRRWLAMNFISLIKSEVELPPEGKFNGGQKVNAMMMMALLLTLCVSGLTMLLLKGALVANVFHVFAFVLFTALLPGHLYLATINPSTRHALKGMTRGYVDASWLQHHHILMFEKLQKTVFDDVIVEHARKNELKMIYNRVYKEKLSYKDFAGLCRRSEAILVARRNGTPVAFMQVVGDGRLHGCIAREEIFTASAEQDDFMDAFTAAAEAVIGHTLSR